MTAAPLPPDEGRRLAALQALSVLDSPPEPAFDALVRTAAAVAGTPIAVVSLVDAERQWFKARIGLPETQQTPRDQAFCAHALLRDDPLVVPDATADPRFADNPLVTGEPHIRFYAGVPLVLTQGGWRGLRIGTLCIIDHQPRHLLPQQLAVLQDLALVVVRLLEGRRALAEEQAQQARLAAMARSEARFQALSDAVPVGVFAADARGVTEYVNPHWQRLTGLDAAQGLAQGWHAAVHPLDREPVLLEWDRCVGSGEALELSFRLRRPDGRQRHVRVHAEPLWTDEVLQGFVGALSDITHSESLLERLRHGEERVRRLYERTPAMMHSIDPQGRMLSVSDRWLERLGYTRDEVLGRPSTDFMTESSQRYAVEMIRPRFLELGRCDREPIQLVARNGEVVAVEVHAILERDAAGQPLRSLSVLEDVSAQLAAERQLMAEHKRLTNLIDGTRVGTWEWNVQTGETRFNPRWAEMVGLGLADLHPFSLDTFTGLLHPDDHDETLAALQAYLDGDRPSFEREFRMRHADGSWVWVYDRGAVISRSADGRPEWVCGMHQDITQQVQARLALREAHERLTLATDGAEIGIWELRFADERLQANARMWGLLGIEPSGPDDDLVQAAQERLQPEDVQRLRDQVRHALQADHPLDSELGLQWPDGTRHQLRLAARIERDEAGQALRMLGACWDVSAERQLQQQLTEQHELLQVTLKSIGDAVITTDAHGRVRWLNPAAERMTGWRTTEATGRQLAEVFHRIDEDSRQPVPDPVHACLALARDVAAGPRALLLARDGREYGIEDSAAPICSGDGRVLGVVLVFRDVTEQRRLSGEMRYRASHDMLTGLVNRAEFDARLRRALQRAREDGSVHALLYIDLDQFKRVNDAAGHTVGDQLLQQFARLLGDTLRSRDTLARLGGDEFAAILEHCTVEQASRVAHTVCERMEAFRFHHEGQRFRVGTSIGLVPIDARWADAAGILQAADTACYAAKEAGRNRVHVWFDSDQAMHERQGEMQWAARLEQALDEDRFDLHLQHIVPLSPSDEGLHAEVLVRLREADGTLVLPTAFLPAAERFQLASRLDRWVLRAATQWLQQHGQRQRIGLLGINLSGQSIGDRAFHTQAVELLSGLEPDVLRRLCLEVTETAAVTNLADAARFIEQVRALGVRIALDDFGAGASSFGYLKSMKVDYLKIDGQFIRNLMHDPLDRAAVRCFVDVARAIQVQTVAEFVEDRAVHDELLALGVDYAQGHLLHRPQALPAALA